MTFINVYKHFHPSRMTHFTRVIKSHKNWFESVQWHQEPKLFTPPVNVHCTSKRFFFTNDSNISRIQLPPLTDDEPILPVSPFFHVFKSIIYLHWLGIVYQTENLAREIVEGSKQAVVMTSQAIAEENFDILDGLVTDSVINKLKMSVPRLSEAQKKLISIANDDIYQFYPYEVHRSQNEDSEDKVTSSSIEVGMIFLNYRKSSRNITDAIISNCCFKRTYTDDIPSPWIITMFNQFTIPALPK